MAGSCGWNRSLASVGRWRGLWSSGGSRSASVASLALLALIVPAMAALGHRGWSLVWLGLTAVLILYRHKGNIHRLIVGAEQTVEYP